MYNKYFNYVKCDTYTTILKTKKSVEEKIIKFFDSLLLTYKRTKDIPNFNAKNNLIINSIKHIYYLRKNEFESGMKKKFIKYLSFPSFVNELKNPTIVLRYIIKNTTEPTLLFGENFDSFNEDNCIMQIDKSIMKFTKTFLFKEEGLHSVGLRIKMNKKIPPITNFNSMFYSISELESADFSQYNSIDITNTSYMFSGCCQLANVNFNNFNTTNVTDMHWMFCGCSSLVNLDLSSFFTVNVTDMSCMFYGCKSLVSLNIMGFNTEKVTDMSYMFRDCASIKYFFLSHFDTSQVTNMQYMFYGCSSLVDLNLKNFNTSNVNNMSYMFTDCKNLKNLVITGFDISNVNRLWDIFNGCDCLSEELKEKYSYNDKNKK